MRVKINGLWHDRVLRIDNGVQVFECYTCPNEATTLRHTHSGAVYRACAEHGGVCHPSCWH